jgi:hypothetical protein
VHVRSGSYDEGPGRVMPDRILGIKLPTEVMKLCGRGLGGAEQLVCRRRRWLGGVLVVGCS